MPFGSDLARSNLARSNQARGQATGLLRFHDIATTVIVVTQHLQQTIQVNQRPAPKERRQHEHPRTGENYTAYTDALELSHSAATDGTARSTPLCIISIVSGINSVIDGSATAIHTTVTHSC